MPHPATPLRPIPPLTMRWEVSLPRILLRETFTLTTTIRMRQARLVTLQMALPPLLVPLATTILAYLLFTPPRSPLTFPLNRQAAQEFLPPLAPWLVTNLTRSLREKVRQLLSLHMGPQK